MNRPLRILSLEDDPDDAGLIQEKLEADGITCEVVRVESRPAFEAAIGERFDLILADYTLPSFDGLSALKLALGACPDVPFIFVSGTLGEEVAIEALQIGATDYVLKTRLSRLVPSVLRALKETNERAARMRTRGRGKKLKVNYRTTDEIRRFAVKLLEGRPIDDLDNGEDDQKGVHVSDTRRTAASAHFPLGGR
jgi:DNA-binding response OmpR family regulator